MAAFRIRQAAAQSYLDEQIPSYRSNGDEARYADKRASFAKTLPHNDAGEVDVEAFARFVSVLSSGDPDAFEALRRDPAAEVPLNDPQATYAFDLAGLDGCLGWYCCKRSIVWAGAFIARLRQFQIQPTAMSNESRLDALPGLPARSIALMALSTFS